MRRLLAYLLICFYLLSPQSGLAQTVALVMHSPARTAHTLQNGIDYADKTRRLSPPGSTLEGLDGGVIAADGDMALLAGNIDNTGYIIAGDDLTIDAETLLNRKRNAAYFDRQFVASGFIDIWGDTVQPGGIVIFPIFG